VFHTLSGDHQLSPRWSAVVIHKSFGCFTIRFRLVIHFNFNSFSDLTPAEQQLLLEIRRRKTELLQEIQVIFHFSFVSCFQHAVAGPTARWRRLSLA
jgi:hypothetical protein